MPTICPNAFVLYKDQTYIVCRLHQLQKSSISVKTVNKATAVHKPEESKLCNSHKVQGQVTVHSKPHFVLVKKIAKCLRVLIVNAVDQGLTRVGRLLDLNWTTNNCVNRLSERKNSKGIVKYSTAVEEGWRKPKDALERFLKGSKIRSSRIIRLVEEVILSETEHRDETRPCFNRQLDESFALLQRDLVLSWTRFEGFLGSPHDNNGRVTSPLLCQNPLNAVPADVTDTTPQQQSSDQRKAKIRLQGQQMRSDSRIDSAKVRRFRREVGEGAAPEYPVRMVAEQVVPAGVQLGRLDQ